MLVTHSLVAVATLCLKRLISLKIYQNRSNSVKKPLISSVQLRSTTPDTRPAVQKTFTEEDKAHSLSTVW